MSGINILMRQHLFDMNSCLLRHDASE